MLLCYRFRHFIFFFSFFIYGFRYGFSGVVSALLMNRYVVSLGFALLFLQDLFSYFGLRWSHGLFASLGLRVLSTSFPLLFSSIYYCRLDDPTIYDNRRKPVEYSLPPSFVILYFTV